MTTPRVRAFLFDLDGTLADTLDDIAGAMNFALEACGLPPHATDAYRRMVGDGAGVLAARAVRERADLADAVLAAYKARYDAHVVDRTRPYPGVAELVGELDRRGVPKAVLSNKPDATTREVVRRLFPHATFRAVFGEREGVPRKPSPVAALAVAAELGAAPAEIAFVGDTPVDVRTATAAGMLAVGVLWGFRDRAELETAGARVIVARPSELLALLEEAS